MGLRRGGRTASRRTEAAWRHGRSDVRGEEDSRGVRDGLTATRNKGSKETG